MDQEDGYKSMTEQGYTKVYTPDGSWHWCKGGQCSECAWGHSTESEKERWRDKNGFETGYYS